MLLTAQPVQSEPHTATPMLSTRKGVAKPEAPLCGMSPTFPLGLASTIVDLANSPSSMFALYIFLGRWKDIITRSRFQTNICFGVVMWLVRPNN